MYSMHDPFKLEVGGKHYQLHPAIEKNTCVGCAAIEDTILCSQLNDKCNSTEDSIFTEVKSKNTENGTGKKYDQSKNRYDLVPAKALDEAVKVLTRGADKYNEAFGDENWRKLENPKRRYYGALMRHLQAVRMGETHDPETSIHHYAHAMTNLMFLLEMELDSDYKNIKGWS